VERPFLQYRETRSNYCSGCLKGDDVTVEEWLTSAPQHEGVYEMKSPDGTVEVVEIQDLAIDQNPARPRNFHVIHVNGGDKENPEYFSLNAFGQYDMYSWRKARS
jgi:hypothetical protein